MGDGLIRVANSGCGRHSEPMPDYLVQVGGTIVTVGLQRIGLEDIEYLQNMNATEGRRCGDNLEIAEGAPDRRRSARGSWPNLLGDQPVIGRHRRSARRFRLQKP